MCTSDRASTEWLLIFAESKFGYPVTLSPFKQLETSLKILGEPHLLENKDGIYPLG